MTKKLYSVEIGKLLGEECGGVKLSSTQDQQILLNNPFDLSEGNINC
jgi:hypothetical protein